jgi:hypothetical protein
LQLQQHLRPIGPDDNKTIPKSQKNKEETSER